jgi:transcriptional regulator with XRE-family HTH domain
MPPLGAMLHSWRLAEGLSLPEAARRLGVHPTTYQRWERGQRPYTRQLPAIAAVVGRELATVTTLAGPGPRRTGRPAPLDASVLTRARIAAAVNRVELGRTLHVGPATVYRWERGLTRPPEELLPRLAHELRLSGDELDAALAEHPVYRFDGEVLPGLGTVLRDRGLTRPGARRLLGVSATAVYEWEIGRTRVPAWALRRLAAACGRDVAALVDAGRRRAPRPSAAPSLAVLRRRVRMTQREAAAVLRISASTLGRQENGRRPVDLPMARTMARVYQAPLAAVIQAAGLELPPVLHLSRWDPEQLPDVLTGLRTASGLSRSSVARVLGVSHSTVARWESGESVPCSSVLASLELHYDIARGRLAARQRTDRSRPGHASRSA